MRDNSTSIGRLVFSESIVAIATPPGQGGVAIVRVSGPQAKVVMEKLFTPKSKKLEKGSIDSHKLIFGDLRTVSGALLDECLAVAMASPHSYTGEDVVEFHVHGGSFLAQEVVLACLESAEHVRLALPGEFTQRAFLMGRLDLTQAEAVAELIHARTKASLNYASEGLKGRFSERVFELQEQLGSWLSRLEAEIDFGDEVESISLAENTDICHSSLRELEVLLSGSHAGRIITQGLRTIILGEPNAGKSTLLNKLMGFERAIISDIPGTTRDTIEESVVLGGVELTLIDTAGIRSETQDKIEEIGIKRSKDLASRAELILWVIDGQLCPNEEMFSYMKSLAHSKEVLAIVNKSDLGSPQSSLMERLQALDIRVTQVSLLEKSNFEKLEESIASLAADKIGERVGGFGWNERQIQALSQARNALLEVKKSIESDMSSEFFCLDLRKACQFLLELTGKSVSEDILDNIFSKFCLGK